MTRRLPLLLILPCVAVLAGCPFDSDAPAGVEPLESGLQTLQSGGVEREYFVLLPADNAAAVSASAVDAAVAKPLIIGFHGTGGSFERWTSPTPAYDLVATVGDQAIMIFPNALPDATGSPQWDFEPDFEFFADLLAELDRRGLDYDRNRLFVTGHSSGGGFAHEVGCRFGDVIRAIAPSAGSLISGACTGSVAVLMSQGTKDGLVPLGIAQSARNFWTLYNGWDVSLATPAEVSPCIDHALLPLGSAAYPVWWCQHEEGDNGFAAHRWASFTSAAVWAFFSGLPEVEPSSAAPPGGGNERVLAAADTTVSFALTYPANANLPIDGAITLYPPDTVFPIFSAPSVFLNTNFPPGSAAPGSTVSYANVPITFFVFGGDLEFPSDWIMQFSVYVQGGSRPIPTDCVDLVTRVPVTFIDRSTPIVIGEALELMPSEPVFGGSCDDL